MQERCTCGAVLPEDARFCHKCGKPQLEEDQQRLNTPVAENQPVQSPLEPPSQAPAIDKSTAISFRNSRAVVITLLVAAGAMVGFPLISLFAPPLFPFFLCGVGFAAVRIYRARSTETLTPGAGARLGWMTGLWIFLITAVFITLLAIAVASPEGWEQMRTTWARVPRAAKLTQMSQHEFLMQMLVTLPVLFLLLTLLPGLGGLLGAKFSARRQQS